LAVEQNDRLERVLHIRTETVVWGRYDAESVGDVLSALDFNEQVRQKQKQFQ
jgi:hypothetical protein